MAMTEEMLVWSVRKHPELGTFDTREEAIAAAWEITPPGKNRPYVDATNPSVKQAVQDSLNSRMQMTLQSFRQMGSAVEAASAELTKMMTAMTGIRLQSIELTAREKRAGNYDITVVAEKEPIRADLLDR